MYARRELRVRALRPTSWDHHSAKWSWKIPENIRESLRVSADVIEWTSLGPLVGVIIGAMLTRALVENT
jgi:hypothetical protein